MARLFAATLAISTLPLGAEVSERAHKLRDEALVFDAHVPIVNRQLEQGGSIAHRCPDGHVDLPLPTEGMLRRGWSEQRIRKFLGGNLLRVFRQISQ